MKHLTMRQQEVLTHILRKQLENTEICASDPITKEFREVVLQLLAWIPER